MKKRNSLAGKLLLFTIFLLSLSACSGMGDSMTSMGGQAFDAAFSSVMGSLAEDPDFSQIPLAGDTDMDWLKGLAQGLWDQDMTEGEFVQEGVNAYPGYQDSFQTIASQLTSLM